MSNNIKLKPGDKCEVFNRKGISKGIMYYGYEYDGTHYFFTTKSKAVLARTEPMNSIVGTIYKSFNYLKE